MKYKHLKQALLFKVGSEFKETFADKWEKIKPLFQMKYELTINPANWEE